MANIHLEDRHMAILRTIIEGHPGCYVFGSRVRGDHKPFSDIDLCFIRDTPMPLSEIGRLADAFEESDLPFKVDIVDYQSCSDEFKTVIDRDKVAL